MPPRPLMGQVAVVAGATRGAGRGIARALGAAGAFVYCTGRSVRGAPSPYDRPETIEETAEQIVAAGGGAVALRVDHAVEAEIAALFERVQRDHGRLDILVNSIAGEDPLIRGYESFWNADLARALPLLGNAVVSRMLTAKHAARLMVAQRRGLIVEVTENDLFMSSGDPLAQLVRVAHKALATMYAAELRAQGVAALSITPGFLRSERMLEHFGVTEDDWRKAGESDANFLESESPQFVGRAIAALAADPALLEQTGGLFSSWQVARERGLTDIDGRRPDWGALDIDYAGLPQFVIDAIGESLDVQTRWLDTLAARTHAFRTAFRKQTAKLREPPNEQR